MKWSELTKTQHYLDRLKMQPRGIIAFPAKPSARWLHAASPLYATNCHLSRLGLASSSFKVFFATVFGVTRLMSSPAALREASSFKMAALATVFPLISFHALSSAFDVAFLFPRRLHHSPPVFQRSYTEVHRIEWLKVTIGTCIYKRRDSVHYRSCFCSKHPRM